MSNNTDVVSDIPAARIFPARWAAVGAIRVAEVTWVAEQGRRLRLPGRPWWPGPMEPADEHPQRQRPSSQPSPAQSTSPLRSGTEASPGCLVVVRHGETAWSRSGRHTGRTDVPLTADGQAQARALRAILAGRRFSAVWTSPLARAAATAALAGFGDRAQPMADLEEWDYGAYEGVTTAEIRRGRPGWSLWDDGVEGGESLAAVGERADRVVAAARRQPGDTLVFAHGHLLRVLAARWLGLAPVAGRFFVLGAARVGELGWEHGGPALLSWNLAPPGAAS